MYPFNMALAGTSISGLVAEAISRSYRREDPSIKSDCVSSESMAVKLLSPVIFFNSHEKDSASVRVQPSVPSSKSSSHTVTALPVLWQLKSAVTLAEVERNSCFFIDCFPANEMCGAFSVGATRSCTRSLAHCCAPTGQTAQSAVVKIRFTITLFIHLHD